MEAVFQKMLKSALGSLMQLQSKGLVQFKVICGDKEWGDLEVMKEKPKEKKPRYYETDGIPYGFMRDYVLKYLNDLAPGKTVHIPYPPHDADVVRSNAGSYASKMWGKASYTTTINKITQCVEMYRHTENPQFDLGDLDG